MRTIIDNSVTLKNLLAKATTDRFCLLYKQDKESRANGTMLEILELVVFR